MLQIETVEPGTFSLLEKLQAIPELKDFFLVGGTALSLIYFGDAEESEDPVSLKGQTWKKVKKSIEKKVRDFLI
jgi:hypothetical protein